MRFFGLFFCLLLAAVVGSSPVAADERIGAFMIFDDMDDVILLDGEIGINTPLEFRRAVSARPDAKVIGLLDQLTTASDPIWVVAAGVGQFQKLTFQS